jgi:hypothetical protein
MQPRTPTGVRTFMHFKLRQDFSSINATKYITLAEVNHFLYDTYGMNTDTTVVQ